MVTRTELGMIKRWIDVSVARSGDDGGGTPATPGGNDAVVAAAGRFASGAAGIGGGAGATDGSVALPSEAILELACLTNELAGYSCTSQRYSFRARSRSSGRLSR